MLQQLVVWDWNAQIYFFQIVDSRRLKYIGYYRNQDWVNKNDKKSLYKIYPNSSHKVKIFT